MSPGVVTESPTGETDVPSCSCVGRKSDVVVVFSPFEVQVSEEAGPQKVRAWGPGLETGSVGKSADFVVEAIGTEVGTLGT